MEFQSLLVQYILYFKMILIFILLQPYLKGLKKSVIRQSDYFLNKTVLKHIFYGFYAIIAVMLFDSCYRWSTNPSLLLRYQSEKNFYLCLFTLFVSFVFKRLTAVLEGTFLNEKINKENVKQQGNSMTFVQTVINESKQLKEENERLKEKLKGLGEVKDNSCESEESSLKSERDRYQSAYEKLKEKYDILKRSQAKESDKDK